MRAEPVEAVHSEDYKNITPDVYWHNNLTRNSHGYTSELKPPASSVLSLPLPQRAQRHGQHTSVAERQHVPAGIEQDTGLEILAATIR